MRQTLPKEVGIVVAIIVGAFVGTKGVLYLADVVPGKALMASDGTAYDANQLNQLISTWLPIIAGILGMVWRALPAIQQARIKGGSDKIDAELVDFWKRYQDYKNGVIGKPPAPGPSPIIPPPVPLTDVKAVVNAAISPYIAEIDAVKQRVFVLEAAGKSPVAAV